MLQAAGAWEKRKAGHKHLEEPFMGNVRRIYVEKKAPFAVKAKELKGDLKNYLNLKEVEDVRMFIRYDVEHISDEVFEKACTTVFSEPPVDILYREQIEVPEKYFTIK